jgi:hypothetical protein
LWPTQAHVGPRMELPVPWPPHCAPPPTLSSILAAASCSITSSMAEADAVAAIQEAAEESRHRCDAAWALPSDTPAVAVREAHEGVGGGARGRSPVRRGAVARGLGGGGLYHSKLLNHETYVSSHPLVCSFTHFSSNLHTKRWLDTYLLEKS